MSLSRTSTVIKPNKGLLDYKINELWRYRDLLILFIKRDILTVYKQTILGPLWYIIQPALTTLMFTFVFGKMANISTDGLPHVLFYLLGITFWSYFADCLNKTSNTFVLNQAIFGKVYFPRAIVPASTVISALAKLLVQLLLFLGVWAYYLNEGVINPNWQIIFLTPLVILFFGGISLGFGMLFSSLTTKYKDLSFLLAFGVQLWMYVSPVIYPMSSIPNKYLLLVKWNPIAPLLEVLRYGFLGRGTFDLSMFAYSGFFSFLILALGYCVFTKVEQNFMDTV